MIGGFLPFAGPVFAFLAVLVLVPLVRRVALRLRFVDQPGGRKTHKDPVPPIGGLVIFPIYMAVALFTGVTFGGYWPLFLALGLILVAGALDDSLSINPWVKFVVQFAAAILIVVPGHAQLYQLGDLFGFGHVGLGFMSLPFSVVAVVLLINAINLMDGLDGLAAGKSCVVLFWLILASVFAGEWAAVLAMGPLMGALAGFLLVGAAILIC